MESTKQSVQMLEELNRICTDTSMTDEARDKAFDDWRDRFSSSDITDREKEKLYNFYIFSRSGECIEEDDGMAVLTDDDWKDMLRLFFGLIAFYFTVGLLSCIFS